MQKPIALAADHGGIGYKDRIATHLRDLGHQVVDFGTYSTDSTDYPDLDRRAADAVSTGES